MLICVFIFIFKKGNFKVENEKGNTKGQKKEAVKVVKTGLYEPYPQTLYSDFDKPTSNTTKGFGQSHCGSHFCFYGGMLVAPLRHYFRDYSTLSL